MKITIENLSEKFPLTADKVEYGQMVESEKGTLCIKINDTTYKNSHHDLMLDLSTGEKGWASGWTRFRALFDKKVYIEFDSIGR